MNQNEQALFEARLTAVVPGDIFVVQGIESLEIYRFERKIEGGLRCHRLIGDGWLKRGERIAPELVVCITDSLSDARAFAQQHEGEL